MSRMGTGSLGKRVFQVSWSNGFAERSEMSRGHTMPVRHGLKPCVTAGHRVTACRLGIARAARGLGRRGSPDKRLLEGLSFGGPAAPWGWMNSLPGEPSVFAGCGQHPGAGCGQHPGAGCVGPGGDQARGALDTRGQGRGSAGQQDRPSSPGLGVAVRTGHHPRVSAGQEDGPSSPGLEGQQGQAIIPRA